MSSPSSKSAQPPQQRTLKAEFPVDKLHLVPSPYISRRNRTFSASRTANEGPSYTGTCVSFSQSGGHGFIRPDNGKPEDKPLFIHVSDVESEWVPIPGDRVEYKLAAIPPNMDKVQAVQCHLIDVDTSKHHRWSTPE